MKIRWKDHYFIRRNNRLKRKNGACQHICPTESKAYQKLLCVNHEPLRVYRADLCIALCTVMVLLGLNLPYA